MKRQLQNTGSERSETKKQRDEEQDGDPAIEGDGQPPSGAEPLRQILLDPERLDLIIEARDVLQRVGGEQPDGVGPPSLQAIDEDVEIAGLAFDQADTVTRSRQPIFEITLRLVAELTHARQQL